MKLHGVIPGQPPFIYALCIMNYALIRNLQVLERVAKMPSMAFLLSQFCVMQNWEHGIIAA